MWVLLTITVSCTFWEFSCDLDVVKKLMEFDTKAQCEQMIVDIHKTASGMTLVCKEQGRQHE